MYSKKSLRIFSLFISFLAFVNCYSQDVDLKNQIDIIKLCESQIEKDTTDAKWYFYRGTAYYNLGKHKSALIDFLKANSKDNDNIEIMNHIATVYLNDGNNKLSKIWYLKSLETDANNYEAHLGLGNIFLNIRNVDSSKYHFYKALSLEKTPDILNNIGLVYIQKGEFEHATKKFTEAIQLDSKAANALFNRAYAYIQLNNFKQAEKDLIASINVLPENPYAYYYYSILEIKTKKRNAACEKLCMAKKFNFNGEILKELESCKCTN